MLKTKSNKGFTIIEVLIVLAIAGLIMLIVFLAVPALQRNAHNTSIKNDVSNILGGMTEFENNNNGAVPNKVANGTATGLDVTSTTAGANAANVKLGYIDGSGLNGSIPNASASQTNNLTAGQAKIYTKAVCAANGVDATSNNATSRNFVVLYALEGGAKLCQAS